MLRQATRFLKNISTNRKSNRFVGVKILGKKIFTKKNYNEQVQQYSPKLQYSMPEGNTLYRGDMVVDHVIPTEIDKLLSMVVYGAHGRHFPLVVTPNDLSEHQGSSKFLGLTANKERAYEALGGNKKGVILTVDTETVGSFINLNQTLDNASNNPELKYEEEYIALLLLYCCIKSFEVNGVLVNNPFYLSKEMIIDKPEVISKLQTLQNQFILLLRNLYGQSNELSSVEMKEALVNFSRQFISLYDDIYGDKNPFKIPLAKFNKQFPEFSSIAKINSENQGDQTLDSLVDRSGHALFESHPYRRSFNNKRDANVDSGFSTSNEIVKFLEENVGLSDEEKAKGINNINKHL